MIEVSKRYDLRLGRSIWPSRFWDRYVDWKFEYFWMFWGFFSLQDFEREGSCFCLSFGTGLSCKWDVKKVSIFEIAKATDDNFSRRLIQIRMPQWPLCCLTAFLMGEKSRAEILSWEIDRAKWETVQGAEFENPQSDSRFWPFKYTRGSRCSEIMIFFSRQISSSLTLYNTLE